MAEHTLRGALPGDEKVIVALLKEAAVSQMMAEQFCLTVSSVKRNLIGKNAAAKCVLALHNNEPVGIALWFWSYRSFRGRRGLFLEDLYVRSPYRRQGYGKRMMAYLARIARAEGAFIEWVVFDWNDTARDFYDRLGGVPKRELVGYRLDGVELQNLRHNSRDPDTTEAHLLFSS